MRTKACRLSRVARCTAQLVLLAALLVALGGRAAAAPMLGDYRSTELGGAVLPGRWSEGFINADPNHVRNGAHAASWDGANLATQWELTGATLASVTVLDGNPLLPTGDFTVKRVFDTTAAHLFLYKDGGAAPWWTAGDPGAAYDFGLTTYYQVLTVTMDGGAIQNATSVEVFEGTWQDDPAYKVRYGHTVGIYEDAGLGLPAGYPAFEADLQGGEILTGGAWGVVEGTRFTITPEPATLALFGSGLAAMILMRRKQ